MLPNGFLDTALSSFGFVEMIGMLIAGLLTGAFIVSKVPVHDDGTPVSYVVLLIAVVGAVFFLSRAVSLYVDSSPLWPRNVGFAMLWIVYTGAIGIGVRMRRDYERAR